MKAHASASTLYWAAIYFLMACREEPLRSFSSLIALLTISEVFGCVGFAFGFLTTPPPPPTAVAFGFFAAAAVVAGASDATAVSAIVEDSNEQNARYAKREAPLSTTSRTVGYTVMSADRFSSTLLQLFT
ncbi:hypothetical protein EVAR_62508_1 [Eumeta japonica]|uniref:Uncharacterized protein n=1 Tax=Eumeta variegata TaxID=151549 RepID=A0A4C1SDE3_EUMVA|nr:hypothetical protein EVAR_62508_1 [Eumeta japonica]